MATNNQAPAHSATDELHIVVAALESQGQFVGYTAVTAPLEWNDAIAKWESLEKHRQDISGRKGTGKGHVAHYAVRSVADPRFAPLIGRGYADEITKRGYHGFNTGDIKAAKAWAKLYGYRGAGGGWIYGPNFGKPVVQGWGSFAVICKRQGRIAKGADGKWYVLDRETVQ